MWKVLVIYRSPRVLLGIHHICSLNTWSFQFILRMSIGFMMLFDRYHDLYQVEFYLDQV